MYFDRAQAICVTDTILRSKSLVHTLQAANRATLQGESSLSNYRVKYKKGDLEIEVESTEKSYVDGKLAELLSTKSESTKPAPRTNRRRTKTKEDPAGKDTNQVDVAAIVDAINDSDDHAEIDKYILSKVGQLPRIIMCLHFAAETLDSPTLTTGNIQTITDQLGIKIGAANAGATIKNNQKYFTAGSVRKKGAIMKYKLNRKGQAAYNSILKGEKPS